MDGESVARLIYLLLLMVAVGGWFLTSGRIPASGLLKQAAIWVLVFLGVIAVIGL